jgi:hypothetical protein
MPCVVRKVSYLLYKRLPIYISCVAMCRLQLYREMSVFVISSIALHIDTTALSDGTYELIPDSEGGDPEAQVHAAVLTEAPNQSSEVPKAEIVSDYREGKPRT